MNRACCKKAIFHYAESLFATPMTIKINNCVKAKLVPDGGYPQQAFKKIA